MSISEDNGNLYCLVSHSAVKIKLRVTYTQGAELKLGPATLGSGSAQYPSAFLGRDWAQVEKDASGSCPQIWFSFSTLPTSPGDSPLPKLVFEAA